MHDHDTTALSALPTPPATWTGAPLSGPPQQQSWPLPPAPADPHPVPAQPARPRRRGPGGALGALAAIGAAVAKYGLIVFKLGKLGPTLISMLVSLGIFVALFGWEFGVGILGLIAVHEMGHWLFARAVGVPVTAPIFLGPFGALIGMKRIPEDPRQEAVIAIGGPVVGTAASLLLLVASAAMPVGDVRFLIVALAYFGCLLNLFNLVPVMPLDGGRVLGVLSRWFNVLGLVLMGLLVLGFLGVRLTPNPFLLIILVLGVVELVRRWRRERGAPPATALSPGARAAIFAAYIAALSVAAIGMTTAHESLIQYGYLNSVS